jgi:hypothetical protein
MTDKVGLAKSEGRGLTDLEAACATFNSTGHTEPNKTATSDAGTTHGLFTFAKLEDANLPFGDYVVCLLDKSAGKYVPVPPLSASEGPFLKIVPEFPADAVKVTGVYKDQYFSVKKGIASSLAVLGSQLSTGGDAGIALTTSSTCEKAISSQIADWDHKVWVKDNVGFAETGSAAESSTYDLTVTADGGEYTICMCDGSVTTGAGDNSPAWNEPSKAWLDYYGVTHDNVLHMIMTGMLDNHTNAGALGSSGMTLKEIIVGISPTTNPATSTTIISNDEAYWMFISAFSKSGLTFEEIADSIVNASVATTFPAGSMFAQDLITLYSIPTADLLWLAHLGTVEGIPDANLLSEYKMNNTFTTNFAIGTTATATTISMNVPKPTKKKSTTMGMSVVAQLTTQPWGAPPVWSLVTPSWYDLTEFPFDTWEELFEYAYESQVIWPIVSAGCNIPSKYTITVGKLIVTNRAVIGTTYVLDPKGQQSIEIFGTDLKPWADRMTFVNCQDTCGVSKPSKLVGFPDGMYVDAFSAFEPVRDLSESPVDNCPYVNFTQNPYLVDTQFKRVKGRYCVNTTVDLLKLSDISAPSAALVERHACAKKCTQPCVGTHCNCEGNIGLDDAFVDNAICLPKYECEHLCMILGEECHSVTIHETLPRCFLNGPTCAAQVDADDPSVVAEVVAAIEAAEDSGGKKPKNAEEYEVPTLTPLGLNLEYSLYVKVGSGAVPLEPKGAMDDEFESIVWSDSSRGDLVQGSGFSTQSVLRFAPLTLPSAGTYKVCFCDSEVSGKCSTNADFSVEIGKVHVSGLSCLLSVPKLQTAQCFEQYFGGLRCVSGR